jgi:hypothetical protein
LFTKLRNLHRVGRFLSRLLRKTRAIFDFFINVEIRSDLFIFAGKYPTTGSFSQIVPLRFPATKQVET